MLTDSLLRGEMTNSMAVGMLLEAALEKVCHGVSVVACETRWNLIIRRAHGRNKNKGDNRSR